MCLFLVQYKTFIISLTGRRELDFSGHPASHNNSLVNVRETELPLIRKPFAPIATTVQPKSNTTNSINDANTASSESFQKTNPTSNVPFSTPLKKTTDEDQNMTPKAKPIPVPSTPSTLSVAMQTAVTPAAPPPTSAYKAEEIPEDNVEYSFEERRAGFVLPKTHIKSIQV